MNCPNCQTQNPEGAKFCYNCGTALALLCSNCGTELPAGAKFCFNCGQATTAAASTATPLATPPGPPQAQPAAPLDSPPAHPPLATPATADQEDLLQRYIPKGLLNKLQAARKSGLVEGERRVVTILFCDLKGSTAAAAGLDPEEWSEIMNGAFEHMIAPVYRFEGTVARLMGDGLLAFFGAPIAHEDDPQRAVLAGLEIVEAVRGFSPQIEQQWGLPLDVRVGINTGLVVVGAVGSDLRLEYTALGDAINMAARMEQSAEPGTVQIAAPTHKLIAPLFDFQALDGLKVKGVAEPVQAYRVMGAKAAPGRLRGIEDLNAPLIGRQQQMAALHKGIEDLRQGSGQIISVMGEAGLGKSRLVSELHNEIAADSAQDVRWVKGSSQSFETNVPYAPFVDLFQDYFSLRAEETDSSQMAQIRAQIEDLIPGQGEAIAPFLGSLLDLQMTIDDLERIKFLEPPQLRGSIFGHVHGLLEAHLARQPLVLYFDDLHWVDPTSLELLESFMGLVERFPLLIIAAFRPRRQEPSWRFHETAQRECNYRYQTVVLNPLDQDQARQLVANLLVVENMPEGARQKILDRSEGNPFFVEEIIRSLLDDGLIVQEDGHWRATREIGELAIPDTVIGVITARLDRLEENTRQIAQAASVLGREFSVDILADVAEAPQLLDQALLDLQRRELIREKSRLPQLTYIFKHVLTQQAAYNSILLSNRRELHRRAVESLLVHYPDRAAAIAQHCLQARMQTRAMPFLVEAGNHAAHAYASAEAMDYFNQVLALGDVVDDLPSLRAAYEGLGQIQTFTQHVPEAVQTYEALLALGEAKGDIPTQVSALNKLAAAYALHMGQFEKGDALMAQADRLMKGNDDQSGAAESALIRCQMCSMQGDFNGVVRYMGNLVEVGEASGSKEYMIIGLEHISSSLVWLTRYDEAYKVGLEALAIAREIGDREHEAMLLTVSLPLCAIREGDLEQALRYVEEGLRIGEKIGSLIPMVFGRWLIGDISQLQGDYEKALQNARIALEYALPVEEMMPWFVVLPLSSLGSYYLHISDQNRDEIAKFHQHALKVLENPAGALFGGAAWAELGYCAMALGDLDLADDSFQKGLHHPTMLIEVERPRLLAGTALLAQAQGDLEQACSLVSEAIDFAEQRKMVHMRPLTYLTLGKIQGQQGQVEEGIAHLQTAETAALKMGMRPIAWQARIATAELLQGMGDYAGAQAKQAEAQAMVEEIAGLMTDEELREAYLQSMKGKVMVS